MNGENYINNVPTHRVYNNAWINTELHYISIRGRGADPEPSYKKTDPDPSPRGKPNPASRKTGPGFDFFI